MQIDWKLLIVGGSILLNTINLRFVGTFMYTVSLNDSLNCNANVRSQIFDFISIKLVSSVESAKFITFAYSI